jgi:hypothetical protein
MTTQQFSRTFSVQLVKKSICEDNELNVEVLVTNKKTGENDTYYFNSGWDVCEPWSGKLQRPYEYSDLHRTIRDYIKKKLITSKDKKVMETSRQEVVKLLVDLDMFIETI